MVVAVSSTAPTIIQSQNYYPTNDYLYNGMERVDELNLNVYSAAFRTYDPALGRWWQQDPMQDALPGLSAYHQTFGNPVAFADPLGLWPEPGLNRHIGESAGEQWMREHGMGAGYTNPVFAQMPAQNQFSSNLNSFVSGLPWGSRATLNATGNGEFDYILWQGRAYYSNYGSLLGGLSLSGYGSLFLTDASYQYGNSFGERAGNFDFWWDWATNDRAFADDPNIIKMDIGDNPVSWLISGVGVLGAMKYARGVSAAKGSTKLLQQFNSVESIIQNAERLARAKGGVRIGSVTGNADNIFGGLAKQYGAKIQTGRGGEIFFRSGNVRVGLHNSSRGAGPTLHIDNAGRLFKIRVN